MSGDSRRRAKFGVPAESLAHAIDCRRFSFSRIGNLITSTPQNLPREAPSEREWLFAWCYQSVSRLPETSGWGCGFPIWPANLWSRWYIADTPGSGFRRPLKIFWGRNPFRTSSWSVNCCCCYLFASRTAWSLLVPDSGCCPYWGCSTGSSLERILDFGRLCFLWCCGFSCSILGSWKLFHRWTADFRYPLWQKPARSTFALWYLSDERSAFLGVR